MSEAKHTPGPWEAFTNPEFYGWWSVRDSTEQEIGSGDGGFYEPDAHLIAAAPELLEAAKMVIAWYEAEENHSISDFYQRMQMCRDSESALRAAIAKATGKQY